VPGNKLATSIQSPVIHLFDASTGEPVLKLDAHTDDVKAVALWGERLVSVSQDGVACVWNLSTGACESTLRQNFPLVEVTVIRDYLVLGGMNGQLCMWNGNTSAATFVQDPASGVLRKVGEGPDPELTLTNRLLKLTTVADRTLVVQTPRRTTLYTVANGVFFLAYNTQERAGLFSSANELCVMCGDDHIHVWNAGVVSVIPYNRWLLAVCALQDGRFAVADEDRTVRLYTEGSRGFHSAYEVIDTSPSVIFALVQLPDGRLAGADVSNVHVWDTLTRACVLSVPHTGNVWDLQVFHSRLAVISPALTLMD
jgi:WD40 repeat protein